MQGTFEVRTYVGFGESADAVLSGHHRLEEQSVIPGKRIESSYSAPGCRGFARGDVVELLERRRGIIDDRQRIKVSLVCPPGDLLVAKEIGDAFPYGNPLQDFLALASDSLFRVAAIRY